MFPKRFFKRQAIYFLLGVSAFFTSSNSTVKISRELGAIFSVGGLIPYAISGGMNNL